MTERILFRSFNPKFSFCDDGFFTLTSTEQKRVEETCKEELQKFQDSRSDATGDRAPSLEKDLHVSYVLASLVHLDKGYSGLDASRTWLCYWGVHSLNLLGSPVPIELKTTLIRFIKTCEAPDGGYGGGPGQFAHLATTYAAVHCLASLNSEEALESIDRSKLYSFLSEMKQADGSFQMHRGGEIDIRGAYCALSVAALLRIIDEKLTENTAQWVMSCQSYEGGFGGEPDTEAHGGYTFCGMAALALLNKMRLVDTTVVLSWLARKQMQLEGGFQGRSNKLVDGCYSFWQAAVFRIVDCELTRQGTVPLGDGFDSRALQEYILICCQDPHGGLLDKPEKKRDLYHTCYVLSGLSIAQSYVEEKTLILGGIKNAVEETHPVFNILLTCEQFTSNYFANK